MNDLHIRITAWLDYTGRTQADLAKALGVSPASVSHWTAEDAERRHGPAMDKLEPIARFFGVSVPHFLSYMPLDEAKA